MKTKKILICILAMTAVVTLTACNRQFVDTTWKYDRAIITLPDGTVIEGAVDSWKDFADGDQIQVKIDGVTYLVHSSNIVLIDE